MVSVQRSSVTRRANPAHRYQSGTRIMPAWPFLREKANKVPVYIKRGPKTRRDLLMTVVKHEFKVGWGSDRNSWNYCIYHDLLVITVYNQTVGTGRCSPVLCHSSREMSAIRSVGGGRDSGTDTFLCLSDSPPPPILRRKLTHTAPKTLAWAEKSFRVPLRPFFWSVAFRQFPLENFNFFCGFLREKRCFTDFEASLSPKSRNAVPAIPRTQGAPTTLLQRAES